ncbi:hypothetical protein [Acinetobacter radioresistens]|uniref:hypothetical protein n=1 Tax=Acinetobacter radioresistens TaxID=40216 RepID=UPI000619E25D|nr:hypothetical protein [Acinetobacter radioresistens]
MTCVVEPQCECGRVIAKFKQGSIIKVRDLYSNDQSKFVDEQYVFVISHDCDITAEWEKEPEIEVLKVQILNEGEQDPNLVYGKSPREIDLPVLINGTRKYLKLSQLTKTKISKQYNQHVVADDGLVITDKGIKLLRSWLSSRYKRHSFPESLAQRLSKLQSKIENRCKSQTKANGIIALFINVDPSEEELEDGIPYEIDIAIVYESEIAGAEENAQALKGEVEKCLQQIETQFPDSIIGNADVKSDSEFTFKDMRSYVEWRFEHLSFRGEVVGSTVD